MNATEYEAYLTKMAEKAKRDRAALAEFKAGAEARAILRYNRRYAAISKALTAAKDWTTPPASLSGLSKHSDVRVRIAVAENPFTPYPALKRLALDKEVPVRMALTKNWSATMDILQLWFDDAFKRHDFFNIGFICSSPLVSDEYASERAIKGNSYEIEKLVKNPVVSISTLKLIHSRIVNDEVDWFEKAKTKKQKQERIERRDTVSNILEHRLTAGVELKPYPFSQVGLWRSIQTDSDLVTSRRASKLTNDKTLQTLAFSSHPRVRFGVAGNVMANDATLTFLSKDEDTRVSTTAIDTLAYKASLTEDEKRDLMGLPTKATLEGSLFTLEDLKSYQ